MDHSPLVLTGRVMWSKPTSTSMWDIGLQFEEVNFMKMHRVFKWSPEYNLTALSYSSLFTKMISSVILCDYVLCSFSRLIHEF